MSARTPVYKRRTDMEFLPDWTNRDSWYVYKKYWIEHSYEPSVYNKKDVEDFGYNFWDKELDAMEVQKTSNLSIKFDKGNYIRWDSSESISYRISDNPDIFLKFAAIGKDIVPDERKILNFVKRYGVPKNRLGDEIEGSDYLFEQYNLFPLQSFCEYANEAYYVLNLYESLTNQDIGHLRNSLIKGFDYSLWGLFQEIFDPGRLNDAPVPDSLKDKYLLDWDPDDLSSLGKIAFNILGPWSAYIYYGFDGLDEDDFDKRWTQLWIDVINNASPTYVMELAAEAIEFLVHFRISQNAGCSISYVPPQESGLNIYTFKDSWGGKDLLSSMWFTFYLKMTGKLEQEYRTCQACGLPIIPKPGMKLRKNQIYCPGCRQVAGNRRVREVQKLWKENNSIEDIQSITGLREDQIKKWIKKLEHK